MTEAASNSATIAASALRVDVDHDQAGPFASKEPGGGFADPGARPRDHGDSSIELGTVLHGGHCYIVGRCLRPILNFTRRIHEAWKLFETEYCLPGIDSWRSDAEPDRTGEERSAGIRSPGGSERCYRAVGSGSQSCFGQTGSGDSRVGYAGGMGSIMRAVTGAVTGCRRLPSRKKSSVSG